MALLSLGCSLHLRLLGKLSQTARALNLSDQVLLVPHVTKSTRMEPHHGPKFYFYFLVLQILLACLYSSTLAILRFFFYLGCMMFVIIKEGLILLLQNEFHSIFSNLIFF